MPDQLVAAAPHPTSDPSGCRLSFQPTTIREEAQEGEGAAHPNPSHQGQRREVQQRARRVELVERPIPEHHRARAAPEEVITEPDLLDQADGSAVRPEEVVVELLEPRTLRVVADAEAGGQATRDRLAL